MISYFVYNETLTPLYLETLNGISHAGSDPSANNGADLHRIAIPDLYLS